VLRIAQRTPAQASGRLRAGLGFFIAIEDGAAHHLLARPRHSVWRPLPSGPGLQLALPRRRLGAHPVRLALQARDVVAGGPAQPLIGRVSFTPPPAPAAPHARPRAAGVAPGLEPDGCRPHGRRPATGGRQGCRGLARGSVMRALLTGLEAARCRVVARRRWGVGTWVWGRIGGERSLQGMSTNMGPRSSQLRLRRGGALERDSAAVTGTIVAAIPAKRSLWSRTARPGHG
jgi:hypothetical protein